jgi:hypothetical protein
MAQVKGNEVKSEVLGSAGALLASRAVESVGEATSLSKKYGRTSLRRLDVLKDRYRKHYVDIPHNFDLDPETKKPLEAFISGDWEEYCNEKFSEKEASALRVDVEKILSVISNFLDDRRRNLGVMKGTFYDVFKGDIEEKFFSEMIDWSVRCLDCNADEDLIKVIEKRIAYLDDIMEDGEIFPKQLVNDKSVSFGVIREISDMLKQLTVKVKVMHDREFVLSKFKYISNLSEILMSHFLRGFSYFSANLRDMPELDKESVIGIAMKSGTRYENLFCLFFQNAFVGRFDFLEDLSENISENAGLAFDPAAFVACMLDKAKKLGISTPMPDDVCALIPDIFVDAYNLSISMKLISYAANTLSAQGTDNLFCNKEGRVYFGFLINDFQIALDSFEKKIFQFQSKSGEYSKDLYQNTLKTLEKHTDAGQYRRFQKMFKKITGDADKLKKCLEETSVKIDKFSGINPADSLKRKKVLYETIRKRMRARNNDQLADDLERMAKDMPVSLQKMDDAVPDEKIDVSEGRVANAGIEFQHDTPISRESAANDAPLVMSGEREKSVSENMAEQAMSQPNSQHVLDARDDLEKDEAYKKLSEEQAIFLREKIKNSLEKIIKYESAFLGKLFRWPVNVKLSAELRLLFTYGIREFPELDIYPMELSIFYDRLSDFIDQLQDGNSHNKYKLKDKVAEDIYLIVRELKEIFDKKQYRHLIICGEKEVEKLKCKLDVQGKKLSEMCARVKSQKMLLSQKEHELSRKLGELNSLRKAYEDQSMKLSDAQAIRDSQATRIEALENDKAKKDSDISDLITNRSVLEEKVSKQGEKLIEQAAEIAKLRGEMHEEVKKQVIAYMRSLQSEESEDSQEKNDHTRPGTPNRR